MIKYPTYFVDIDGTLVKYRAFDQLQSTEPEPIESVLEFVNTEHEKGACIVVTTARPAELRDFTEKELSKIGLHYSQLVMGIGRGTRYIINDRDPDEPLVDRAVGINLVRNHGL